MIQKKYAPGRSRTCDFEVARVGMQALLPNSLTLYQLSYRSTQQFKDLPRSILLSMSFDLITSP